MGVKCPKHNVELTIDYTSLNLFGSQHPVVTGQCPICKIKFLSREIMSASGSFKISGQIYEYLDELGKAYPNPVKPINQAPQEKKSSKTISTKDTATTSSKKEQLTEKDWRAKKQKEFEEKRKQEEAQTAQKAEEARKRQQEAKEAAILEIRERNALGLAKPYRVRKINYFREIPKICPHDGEPLDYVKAIQIDIAGTSIKKSSWCCFRCRTAFFKTSDHEKITAQISKAELKALEKANVKPVVIPKETAENTDLVNLAIPQSTLYVCKGLITCKKNNHTVESATGVLLGKNGSVIKINTNYCSQCKKYFISYDEYTRYRQIYGILLGNIKVTNGSFIRAETELADESILHMCGYSVNQNDDLPSSVRQGILQYLIDSKVSNKPEIINYLNFFIKRNGAKQNMAEAVRRWNEDLKWVREYQLNRQRHFEISNIQKNK